MKNRFNPLLQAVVVMSAFSAPIQAGVIYWDGTSTTANADGGNGTWDTVLTNWDSLATAGADTSWPSTGTDNDAVFGGTAGTVTIDAGGVTANDLTFNTANYIIQGGKLTLNGTTPTITNAVAATINSEIGGTGGLTKTGAGALTLSAVNSYTGTTTIAGGTIALSGGSNRLATSGIVGFAADSSLDLGGNSQTLSNLTILTASASTKGILTNGSLTLNGASALTITPSVITGGRTAEIDASGLSSLTISKSGQTITVGGFANGASPGNYGIFKLSAVMNSITADTINVGTTGGANAASVINKGEIQLGTANTINVNNWVLGNTRDGGIVQFETGLVGPSVTLRAQDGISRVTKITIGQNGAGSTGVGTSHFNLSAGSVDALINELVISRGGSGSTTPAVNGAFSMGGGTLDATKLWLSKNESGGLNTNTSAFTQGGGAVKVSSVVFGETTATGATLPVFNAQYTLTAGTLSAGEIKAGAGVFATSSTRRINFNGGTITHYDFASDLTINGVAGTGGSIGIVLGTTGSQTIQADTSRTVVLGAFTAVSGSGSLTKTGAGNLILAGTNSYTGATDVRNGTLQLTSAVDATTALNLGTGSNSGKVILGNAAALAQTVAGLTSTGTGTTNSIVGSAAANSTLTVNLTSGTNTFAGQLGGITTNENSLALTKSGSGTLILSGGNTYSGPTAVTGGTLQITNVAALGTTAAGTTVSAGATLAVSGGLAVGAEALNLSGTGVSNVGAIRSISGVNSMSGTVTLAGATRIGVDADTLELSGAIGGTQDLTVVGAGKLILSGGGTFAKMTVGNSSVVAGGNLEWKAGTGTAAGQYFGVGDNVSGTLTISGGSLTASPTSSLFVGSFTSSAVTGTMNVTGGIFAMGSSQAIYVGGGGYNGNVSGNGILNVSNGTFSTGITTGNFRLGANASLQSGNGEINLSSTGIIETARSVTKGALGAATVNFDGGTYKLTSGQATMFGAGVITTVKAGGLIVDTNTFNGTIGTDLAAGSPSGGLTKQGNGTLTLSGTNSYTGVTNLTAGTVSVATLGDGGVSGNLGAAPNAAANIVFGGGTLQYSAATAESSNRGFTINAASTATFDVSNAAGALTVTGAVPTTTGVLYKTGSGAMILDPGASSLSFGAVSANGGNLTLKSGTYATTSKDAAVSAYNVGAGARGGKLTIDGATLNVGGGNNLKIAATASGSLDIKSGTVTSTELVIGHNGAGTGTQSGGTVTVTNLYHQDGGAGNTYTLSGGTLTAARIYNNTAGVQDFTLNLNGGTLKSASGTTNLIDNQNTGTQISVLLGAGNTIIDTTASSAAIVRPMGDMPSVAGTFTKAGNNTLTLSGANTYSGGTTVNEGSLTVGTGGTLGATTGALAVNNANTAAGTAVVLNLPTAVDTTVGNLSGTLATPISGTNTATINTQTGRNFSVNQTAAGTYAGVIAGPGSFSVGSLSTNTLTLTGANSYTGVTTINAGTLALASGGSLSDTTAVVVNASGSFDISGISTSERIASLTGATGSSLKIGAKTLEFGDANNTSFTGSIDSTTGGELKKIGTGIFTLAASGYTYPVTGPNINISGGTLLTGSANLPTSTAFTLSGGALNTGTFSNTVGSLSVTSDSVIDFAGGGTPMLTFTSRGSWTGLLQIWNWTGSAGSVGTGGTLKFLDGSNGTLIDPSKIQFYSGSGTGSIGSGGVFIGTELVPVPEPTTLFSCSLLFGLVVFQRRRQVGRANGT